MQSPRELRAVCQAGKDKDPGWYLVHRRLSIYVTWALLHTRITLDQVSLLMMTSGVAGAALCAHPSLAVNACGWVLLYLAFLLDKVDGEIARYRRQESVTGILLDRFHHRMVEPLLFLAVGYREFHHTGSVVALIAALATMLAANIIEENQHLPAYIGLKFARETRRWPARPRRAPWPGLEPLAAIMRPLKTFRMFITVLPLVAAACVLEAQTGRPVTTYYLVLSAVSLCVYLVFQSWYYYAGRLEADIAALAEHAATIPAPDHAMSPGPPAVAHSMAPPPHAAGAAIPRTTIAEQHFPGRVIQ